MFKHKGFLMCLLLLMVVLTGCGKETVKDKEEVNHVIELVRNAGGTIVKEPQDVFWGGYHAYFMDLDGYYWEVAWGPNFKYDENEMLDFN